MSKRSVAVILVNWNGKKDTVACLTSLFKIKKGTLDVVPVVVDNASKDDSVRVLRAQFPSVKVLSLEKNYGFTGANNAGIKWALAHAVDYIWILNNDTIVDKFSLALFDVFDDPSVGAAGSKIYFAPGREFYKDRYIKNDKGRVIWYAGGKIDWANMYASHRGVDEVDRGQYDALEQTDFLTGCSMALPSAIVKRLGMFDNRYFAYLEDVDLSLRIKRAGLSTLYVPASVIWHVNASSSGGPGSPTHEYYQTRNRLLLGMRYAPLRTKIALGKEALRQLLSGSSVRKRAIIDAMSGRYGQYHD